MVNHAVRALRLRSVMMHCGYSQVLIGGDAKAVQLLRNSLQDEGYGVALALDANDTLEMIAHHSFELVILNLTFAAINGFDLVRRIRENGYRGSLLVVSPHNAEAAKVTAFGLGADDYVVTPVGSLELVARVGALLRRSVQRTTAQVEPDNTLRFGEIVVDRDTREVLRDGQSVHLTPREFDLLVYLLTANGRIVSRAAILHHVWRYTKGIASRTIDQHVARLRYKIEQDPVHPVHVLTVRKAGYRLRRAPVDRETGAMSRISTQSTIPRAAPKNGQALVEQGDTV